MTETLGHDLDRNVSGEHQRRMPVAKVVKPDPAEPAALSVRQVRVVVEPHRVDQVVEHLANIARHQRVTTGPREHQAVIPVGVAPLFLLGVLGKLVEQQRTNNPVFELYRLVLAPSGLRRHVEDQAAVRDAAVRTDRLLPGADLIAGLHLLVNQ